MNPRFYRASRDRKCRFLQGSEQSHYIRPRMSILSNMHKFTASIIPAHREMGETERRINTLSRQTHKAERIKKRSARAGEAAWKAGGAARIEARRGTRAGDERPREPPARGRAPGTREGPGPAASPRAGPRAIPSAKRERAATPGRPRGRGPARSKEKAPPMSGTPYPPTDSLRSTFGEEGLNFRVRNGIG